MRPGALRSAKSWEVLVIDCSDGEREAAQLALKFDRSGWADKFMEVFEEANVLTCWGTKFLTFVFRFSDVFFEFDLQ